MSQIRKEWVIILATIEFVIVIGYNTYGSMHRHFCRLLKVLKNYDFYRINGLFTAFEMLYESFCTNEQKKVGYREFIYPDDLGTLHCIGPNKKKVEKEYVRTAF